MADPGSVVGLVVQCCWVGIWILGLGFLVVDGWLALRLSLSRFKLSLFLRSDGAGVHLEFTPPLGAVD